MGSCSSTAREIALVRARDGIHAHAARLADDHPQDAPRVVEVVEVEMELGHQGFDERADALRCAHGGHLLVSDLRIGLRHPFRDWPGRSTKRKAWARPTPFVQKSNGLRPEV